MLESEKRNIFIKYTVRKHWRSRGWGGGEREHAPASTSFSEPKKIQKFQFQTIWLLLLWLFRNYLDQKFHDFIVYATILRQLAIVFHILTT